SDRRIFLAVREDNVDAFVELCGEGEEALVDINYHDTTALHIAASTPSPDVIEHILAYPDCDVDLQNRVERATPLHLAAKLVDPEMRLHMVQSLIDAGADTKIKDKHNSLAIDLVPSDDKDTRAAIRQGEGVQTLARGDVVHESDDEPGS
ncbi:hypothetical protein DL93DRAFT_2037128, partial [Clavulina sp. PMI_390]